MESVFFSCIRLTEYKIAVDTLLIFLTCNEPVPYTSALVKAYIKGRIRTCNLLPRGRQGSSECDFAVASALPGAGGNILAGCSGSRRGFRVPVRAEVLPEAGAVPLIHRGRSQGTGNRTGRKAVGDTEVPGSG